MKLPQLFSNRQFRSVVIAVSLVTLIILVINIFIIGGDLFVYTFNSFLNSPLAIIVAVSAAFLLSLMSAERHNRILWVGMLIGWSFWAIAETIWAVYSILGQEVPYPSIADIFWVVGYIPMGIGLIVRIYTMPAKPTRLQYIIIIGASLVTVLVTGYYIFIPIIQSYDPELYVESILNIIYPLADLFLLIVIWRLLFTYEEGDFGFAWRLLAIGFLLMTVSDFIFTYAVWQEIYYPDMLANAISRLAIDVPYTMSYLLWITGIFALRILLKEEHLAVPEVLIPKLQIYGHVLAWTREDGTVLDVSPNFSQFNEVVSLDGKLLADVLRIPGQEGRSIIEKIRGNGRVADMSLQIPNRSGVLYESLLCGVASFDPQKKYSGADILLRIPVDDKSFDRALDQESRGMAKSILRRSGSNYQEETKRFLSDFYLPQLKYLLSIASMQGGAAMCQSLLDRLHATAKEHNWDMQFDQQVLLAGSLYSLEMLKEAFPVLLKTATKYISDVTDPIIIQARMEEMRSQFGDEVLREIAFLEQPGNDVRFADEIRAADNRPGSDI